MKGLKKIVVFTLALCMVLSLCLSGGAIDAKKKSKKAKTPALSDTNIQMIIGDAYELTISNLSKAKLKKVKWSSSNKSVATVKKGKVKAVKAGKCTITAKSGKTTLKCLVNVADIKISDLTIEVEEETDIDEDDNLVLYLSEEEDENSYELDCTFTAKKGKTTISRKKALTLTTGPNWTSSNEKVAKINEDGIITMLSAGTTTITVQVGDQKTTLKLIVSDEEDEDDDDSDDEESDGDIEEIDESNTLDADKIDLSDYDLTTPVADE